jgi:hypothetical protein
MKDFTQEEEMFKRVFTVATVACTVVLSLVFLPAPAGAQDQGYFTYVSRWAVPRSAWTAFEKQEHANDATMQKLVADGTIVDWGDETARVHTEDGYTHADWFTATNRANVLKALEVVWTGATNAAYVATTKHSDLFLHTIAHGGKTASGATGYIRVVFWQARPGAEDALEGYVMKTVKPTLDDDVANGTLLMYNFDKEDIHTEPPGAYNLALLFPNAEAMDRFFADLAAAEKRDPTFGEVFDRLTVAKVHRDDLGRVTAYEHK